MDISFWLTSTTRILGEDNWGTTPLGGAEVSALNLGEELLKLGHSVTYYLQRARPFDRGNLHVKLHQGVSNDNSDFFICVRPHKVLIQKQLLKKKILWSGDAFDQSSNEIFWDKTVANSLDAYVFKSNWQRQTILDKYVTIPSIKTHVISNGVKLDHYKTNGLLPQKNRFIHASTWYRGVFNFIEIWPKILKKIPDAEIHVFSKTSLYSEHNPKDQIWTQIAEELCKLPGMVLREPVPQEILIGEMRKAWLMLYPNTQFVESSCGSALQAICAGTPVVATARASLPETIGDNGLLIEEKEGWQDEFVEGVVRLWDKPQERNEIALSGHLRLSGNSWEKKAKEWEDFLKSL